MLRRIRKDEFNGCTKTGDVLIKCFDGATPRQMNHFAIPFLVEEHPIATVIHSGTNVLRQRVGEEEQTCENIARDIIKIGSNCRDNGVTHIIISSIIVRRGNTHVEKRRREVNILLKQYCANEGYVFVDNEAITLQNIDRYGVHLEEGGSQIVANNILKVLNSLPIQNPST